MTLEPSPSGTAADYLEGLLEGFVAYDANWRLVYINAAGERILGRVRGELLGKTWHEAFPHAIGNEVDAMYQRVMRTRETERMQLFYPHYGRWMEISASAVRSGGIGVYFRDATDEQRLRRSERELADFFDTATMGLHWVGADGIILRANRAELELLGYRAEEYIGRHIAEFHADREAIDDMLGCLTRGERLHEYPARMRRKDGTLVDVLVNSSVLFEDGKFVHTRCFTMDVTARKRAEAALARRARQQQAIARLGERALKESVLERLFAYTADTVAETLELEYANMLELISGGRELLLRGAHGLHAEWAGELRIRLDQASQALYTVRHDAPVVIRELAAETRFRPPPSLLAAGVVSGMSCVIRARDGTAWGVLGAHATRAIEFSTDDVAFLTSVANILSEAIHRERTEAALREADRRKDEFIATLAHELRNPLAPLRNALDLLRLTGPLDASVQRLREVMDRQLNHLVRLVDDLLEVSRISRGNFDLRRELIEAASVVNNAVETAAPLIDARQHTLTVELPREPLWLNGDPVRLAQILANLLNNAAKYTDPGGRITLGLEAGEGEARFYVRDSGCGIDPAAIEHVFEMFSRAGGASRADQEGLGIGLALSRRLAEMHGGTLVGRSEGDGRGAEFVLALPLAQAPLQAGSAAQHADATR
jgi:PAS domain S-box-containing protein